MGPKNQAIGKVECPVKQCAKQCEVYRFRERGDDSKSIANRRFAGKLYCRCDSHGKFGGDAGDADMQDYILKNAVFDTPSARPSTTQSQNARPATPPTPPPKPKPGKFKPQRAAATIEAHDDADDKPAFGFFR